MLHRFRRSMATARKALRPRRTKTGGTRGGDFPRLGLEPLEARLVLDSTVVFNEIMYNPAGDTDDALEWVELYNQLALDMDVSDWSIEGGIGYRFPDGTTVPGHGYLVAAISPTALEAASGYAGALGPFSGRLSNGGEELRLINNDGRVMNVVEYGDGGDWPVGPDGGGVSLAKPDPRAASGPAQSWTFSPQVGGTPGVANFPEPGTLIFDTLLPTGADVSALVPSDGSLGSTWIQPGFDDAAWTTGTTGVGYDNNPDYNAYFGLDLDAPPGGQPAMPMYDVNQTVYVRLPFEITADLGQYDSLFLRMRYDDGFAAYLNGVEIARANAPASPSWDSGATANHSDGQAVQFVDFNVTQHRGVFNRGDNLLAIHGLNNGLTSSDVLISPEIAGARRPTLPGGAELPPIAINEVAGASEADYWLELANLGTGDVELAGMVLSATGPSGGRYAFPPQTVAGGGLLAVTEAQLGFQPADGEKLFLYTPAETELIDARVVTNRLRGRSPQHDGRWLYPDAATPGSANSFDFSDQIVINEIMYHPFPELSTPGTPPTYQTTTLLPIDAGTTWRYNQSGSDLGAGWAAATHPVDNVDWFGGAALLGYETSGLPEPLRTTLNDPRSNDPYVVTYYFETEFDFNGDPAGVELRLRHVIDDGAVFYLNGNEVLRYRMPAGTINAGTLADSTVGNASYVGPTTIPADELLVGTNRFSVEVHQTNTNSSDIVMGAELTARTQQTPGTPGEPYRDSTEEWIELYNRGPEAVDLDGWRLDDAIDYQFQPQTIVQPGGYLVVAKDAAALAEKYPGVDVVGNFSRSLSDRDDRVLLADPGGNPADEVHYYESGWWPEYADGGGSSLELRNPQADNSKAGAWAASDESGKSQWNTYTVRKVCSEPLEVSTVYNELVFGLLDSGEVLLDNISVLRDPDGARAQMIQNGSFQGDAIGSSPATWRLIGTHSGTVVEDPADRGNRVLHLVANGPQQFVHDHVETTFTGNSSIIDGQVYEISLRAKWLAGNSQLNNRLYFTRMGNTIRFEVPELLGTPGARNSRYEANIGPTHDALAHSPVFPAANEAVTVTVAAADPDGVDSVALKWRRDGNLFSTVAMTAGADGTFTGTIPGQSSSSVVQFYVESRDTLGGVSTFPPAGPDSRALYQVDDGVSTSRPVDTIRLVLLAADNSSLYSSVNMMSNNYVGSTVIYNGTEAFYDVDLRQVGSRFIRPNSGYKIRLNPEQKLYGVHDSFRLDRSGGGPRELYMKQMVNRAGGSSVSLYDDIGYVVSPRYTGTMLLQLARYEDLYLDEQFADGSQGTKFELDDITYPTNPSPSPEGYKTGTGVASPDINDRGGDPEAYRGHLLIKNRRAKDDYSRIVDMAQAIHLSGQALYNATNEVMDVDLWMRHYATQAFLGNWDTWGFSRPKNLRIFIRPEDNKAIPLYWDADLANLTDSLIYNGGATSLDEIRDIPQNLRLFWGHMWDLVNRSFNRQYIEPWVNHYNSMGAGIPGDVPSKVGDRANQARSQAQSAIPPVTFHVTTNGGNPFSVEETAVTLAGDGWIDVREIRLQLPGDPQPVFSGPLQVTWTDQNSWRVTVPLAHGPNDVTLGAFDFQGNLIGTDTIAVESTISDRPLEDHLRVTEIHYHPHPPTAEEMAAGFADQDDFEFIELGNTSSLVTLDLTGVQLAEGIGFDFTGSDVLSLAPGEHVVVARDAEAFVLRYGGGVNLAGQYERGLGNDNDTIHLMTGPTTIQEFTYYDSTGPGWPDRADGKGCSLEVIDPAGNYDDPDNWRSGSEYGGSPGFAGIGPTLGVVVNEVLTHSNVPNLDAIELYNPTGEAIDVGGWYLSDRWGWPGAADPGGDGNYKKFRVPEGTILQPDGYAFFDETYFNPNGDWNPEPEQRGSNEFALDGAHGDDVWLMKAATDGTLTHFVDHVDFRAARADESFGRWPNGSGQPYPMTALSLGTINPGPRVGPVVLSEIMYLPPDPDGPGGVDPQDLEFVEIYNPLDETVGLGGWRIRGGIDFDFAGAMQLGPRQAITVLPFDPQDAANAAKWLAFSAYYGLAPGDLTGIVGGYTRFLADDGEDVRLQRPDLPPAEEPWFTPHTLEDEVDYGSVLPWPPSAAGGGDSLGRLQSDLWGNLSSSWIAQAPTPGAVQFGHAAVVGRHVFYNNSQFDGNDPAPEAEDDGAIAPDKEALLPGQTATKANYTSFSLGINGIMVDVLDLPDGAAPDADDFEFRVGNSNDPGTWADAPAPSSITVRPGQGTEGSHRITLVWPHGQIAKQWLQVTVLATPDTGLTGPDVFYFGNAIGESGNSTSDAKVGAIDMLGARDNQRNFLDPAPIDFAYDFNRDARVNSVDMLIARNNQTHFLNALKLITVPSGKAGGDIAAETGSEIAAEAGSEIAAEAGSEIAAETGSEIAADHVVSKPAAGLDWLPGLRHTRPCGESSSSQKPSDRAVDELLAAGML